jgi:hypothetical protein
MKLPLIFNLNDTDKDYYSDFLKFVKYKIKRESIVYILFLVIGITFLIIPNNELFFGVSSKLLSKPFFIMFSLGLLITLYNIIIQLKSIKKSSDNYHHSNGIIALTTREITFEFKNDKTVIYLTEVKRIIIINEIIFIVLVNQQWPFRVNKSEIGTFGFNELVKYFEVNNLKIKYG